LDGVVELNSDIRDADPEDGSDFFVTQSGLEFQADDFLFVGGKIGQEVAEKGGVFPEFCFSRGAPMGVRWIFCRFLSKPNDFSSVIKSAVPADKKQPGSDARGERNDILPA